MRGIRQTKHLLTFGPNAIGVGADVRRANNHAHAVGVAAKRNARRGFSLVELMVVISIITILFGMLGVVFHRLFLSEQEAMRAALTERTVSRLSDQFRRDVHASTTALRLEGVDEGQATSLVLVDKNEAPTNATTTVIYTIRENEVIRTLFAGTQLAGTQPLSREVFRLPGCLFRVSVATQEANTEMVGLIIERQGSTVTPQPKATRPRRSLAIEAALGRDAKLAAAAAVKSPESVKEESP